MTTNTYDDAVRSAPKAVNPPKKKLSDAVGSLQSASSRRKIAPEKGPATRTQPATGTRVTPEEASQAATNPRAGFTPPAVTGTGTGRRSGSRR